jgi:D-glycero-D-manno-heptose 1,7-bisphosphate phosphatase
LDRDGVLNEDHGYVYKLEDFVIRPGVIEGLKDLQRLGYLRLVITNQSGIGRGFYTEDDVKVLHQSFNDELKKNGTSIDAFYYCPHHPQATIEQYRQNCTCRKPGTALVEEAARDYNVDLVKSYFIGDKESDIECALAAGIRPIQILNDQYSTHPKALFHAHNFHEAVEFIRSHS